MSISYFRAMRTTQERRQVIALEDFNRANDEGVVIKIRLARSTHGLPNAWDDYCRGRTRSWKKHRVSQYH